MGHRRSHTHTRASKRGTPEVVSTYPKDKHDTNEEGSKTHDKSRREKRERKRKREREDSSKKKHKEKYRGKSRHHKTREKPKDDVSRRKDRRSLENSESDSGTSFLSSRGACRRHRSHSRSSNPDLPWERSCSRSADVPDNHRLKRFKENNDAFSIDDFRQTYEERNDPMQVEKGGVRRCVDEQLVQVKDAAEGAESKRRRMSVGCDVRNHAQEKGLDGRKDEVLEVELRQRALANFLRHQDVSCKMDEHKETINPTMNVGATRLVSNNEQSELEVNSRWSACSSSALSNAINVDTPIDVSASNTTARVSQRGLREGSELACNSGSNVEEGEIISDTENEAGNANACCVADEGKVLYDKEGITETGDRQPSGDICKEQHQPRLLSAGPVERLPTEQTDVAVACIDEKQEVSQEHAVEGSLNEDPATAPHDINSSFQQKTMSVMRGGEMVQVNYKVYIPKRAAELARRRLQR